MSQRKKGFHITSGVFREIGYNHNDARIINKKDKKEQRPRNQPIPVIVHHYATPFSNTKK
jgi:hypothetical protein